MGSPIVTIPTPNYEQSDELLKRTFGFPISSA